MKVRSGLTAGMTADQCYAAREEVADQLLQLQAQVQKQQQLMQTMSNTQKQMHDTSMAIIRNMK